MYSTVTPTTFYNSTFYLENNQVNRWKIGLKIGFGLFIIPMIIAKVVFQFLLVLEGLELYIAIGVTALILLNIALYLINKLEIPRTKLLIKMNELHFIDNSENTIIIPFEKVNIINLNEKNNEKNARQIVQILTANFQCIIIEKDSFAQLSKNKKTLFNNNIFLINNHENWLRLIETLRQTYLQ